MRADHHQRRPIVVDGHPLSAPLHETDEVADETVGRLVELFVPLPAGVSRADTAAVVSRCLAGLVGLLDGTAAPDQLLWLERAAIQWRNTGLPLETVLHAVHTGFRLLIDRLDHAFVRTVRPPAQGVDPGSLGASIALALDWMSAITTTITSVYTAAMLAAAQDLLPRPVRATEGVGAGTPTGDGAMRYAVLALHVGPATPDSDHPERARRWLRRCRSELAAHCSGRERIALSPAGGTVMLPERVFTDGKVESLLVSLARESDVELTGCVLVAGSAATGKAADHAHDSLDVLIELGCGPGIYSYERMAMEIQLSRPGPVRERLAAILGPLGDQPHLLELLHAYLISDCGRQRTAAALRIHANTVDRRLAHIAALTGCDPKTGYGAWKLRAALIARGNGHPIAHADDPGSAALGDRAESGRGAVPSLAAGAGPADDHRGAGRASKRPRVIARSAPGGPAARLGG
ncbi:PucR family transcriptional regulator [Nocardia sp. NPDC057227]|uniref:PucR family transcriptional regulator n=1 Tax=Nocardia sp. NPDC057227 TaxID=3346056 RepID=UPI00363742B5